MDNFDYNDNTQSSPEIWVDDSQEAISKGFIEYFKILTDPRLVYKTSHSFIEIIFITVCAYISGANSWEGVYEFAEIRKDWLQKYITLKNGLPSRVTYWRVFTHLNPLTFQNCFYEWVSHLTKPIKHNIKHIAIDGKCLRGVHDPKDKNASLILVSAWATDIGLLLGQVKTEVKSNEITAIPKLLDMIQIKDCLVSIDAMGCQVDIAKKIIDLGGDYLFSLKGNQETLKYDVEQIFSNFIQLDWRESAYESVESIEKGHGRIDTRKTYLIKTDNHLNEKWPKLSSIIMVESTRELKDKKSKECRYYISSSSMKAEPMALSIRKHWAIENGLHWMVDVGFREDRQVAQKHNLAENLAVVRRIAFNHLKQEGSNLSIENKRLKAAMSTAFLEKVLNLSLDA